MLVLGQSVVSIIFLGIWQSLIFLEYEHEMLCVQGYL